MNRLVLLVLLIALGILFVPLSDATAECIDVLNVRMELPYDVVTPKGKNLSYFYNLRREEYVIFLSRDGQNRVPHGPFVLQRSCHPGTLRWESPEFVLFERGCGTFCWTVDVLSISGQTQGVFRPLEFDEERNLIMFYAEQDIIGVRNLTTLREQKIPTARACEMASGLCFSYAHFSGNGVSYTWQDGETFSAPLDEALFRQ